MTKKLRPLRVRFGGEIVAEVLFPQKQTGKIALLASGLPSSPSKNPLLQFLSEQGYVAIAPRYRGTWESKGFFLERSPALDLQVIIDELARTHRLIDLTAGEKHLVRVKTIHLFGVSFGGPAVLLNTQHPLVKKVIALAPVLDWSQEGEDEPFDPFLHFVQAGFGGAYRLKQSKDWQKLRTTDFYSPLLQAKKIDGRKIFVLHAKDDRVVPVGPVVPFCRAIGARYYLKPKGGHFGTRHFTYQFFWKKIESFLKA